jgi:hypothetical protein
MSGNLYLLFRVEGSTHWIALGHGRLLVAEVRLVWGFLCFEFFLCLEVHL